MLTAIVIGYGNELRSDDGIGQQIAKAIKYQHLSSVKAIAVHQLTPELAEPLANSQLAIFVDACVNSPSNHVELQSLLPSHLSNINAHRIEPHSLLALSQFLYGNCPPAWLITVPGVNFELGDRLSEIATQGMAIAILKIIKIIEQSNTVNLDHEEYNLEK